MTIVLWIVTAVLAAAFLAAGLTKIVRPHAALHDVMPFTTDFSPWQVKVIGILEVLGAIGLILPAATGVVPVLTPIAAFALALVMVGGILEHLRRHEPKASTPSAVLLVVSLAVGIGWLVF